MNSPSTAKNKKFFMVEEAKQTLPLVRAIVSDIVRQARDVSDRRQRLGHIGQFHEQSAPNENDKNPYREEVLQIEEELEKEVTKLKEYIDELQQLGVEFKDFERGLVDFPHWFDGREVCLCWKLGEEEIGFWHELDAGFQGRQSLFENSVTSNDPLDDGGTE